MKVIVIPVGVTQGEDGLPLFTVQIDDETRLQVTLQPEDFGDGVGHPASDLIVAFLKEYRRRGPWRWAMLIELGQDGPRFVEWMNEIITIPASV